MKTKRFIQCDVCKDKVQLCSAPENFKAWVEIRIENYDTGAEATRHICHDCLHKIHITPRGNINR